MSILVKLPVFRTEDTLTEKDKVDLEVLNRAVNAHKDYPEDQINTMFFHGVYTDIDKNMNVLMAVINNTKDTVGGFELDIAMRPKEIEAEISAIRITAGIDYVGILEPDQAVTIQYDVPVRGLHQDRIFYSEDIESYVRVNRLVVRKEEAEADAEDKSEEEEK